MSATAPPAVAEASTPAVAEASTPAVAETIRGQSLEHGAYYYEFQWHTKWMQVKPPNLNGTTGWARILHSTNPAYKPETVCRIHLCTHNPCRAVHPASKHGLVGPPMHLQVVQQHTEVSAVAGASGSNMSLPATAPPAVAEASGSHMPLSAAVPPAVAEMSLPAAAEPAMAQPAAAEPAMAQPAASEPEVALVGEAGASVVEVVEVHMDQVEVPTCTKNATLHYMHPPAPAPPIDVPQQSVESVTAVAAAFPPEVASQHRIESKLLALAREIRRPRAYVGYSAFILMGLLKKCRPCVWEGALYFDLLQVFAPWALESCTSDAPIAAIPCTLIAQAGGSVELAPVSEQYPLSRTTHYVAGIRIPECEVNGNACSFEAMYASLGIAVLASVMDGDCAFDVMTMMLGVPSSFSARKDLRTDISDYIISRIPEPWFLDLMVACQELELDDVILYRSGGYEDRRCTTVRSRGACAPRRRDA